ACQDDSMTASRSLTAVLAFPRLLRITRRPHRTTGRWLNGRQRKLQDHGDPSSRVSAHEDSPIAFLPKASVRLGAGYHRERQMPLYEHVFLARQDMSGQQVEAL